MTRPIVLDASVGVKWFRDEAGSVDARELLALHGAGEVQLAVPAVFVFEVLDVARRHLGNTGAEVLWDTIQHDEIEVVSAALIESSLAWSRKLDCTLYDAAAPALAEALDAQLVSADRRAHGEFPGVRIIG